MLLGESLLPPFSLHRRITPVLIGNQLRGSVWTCRRTKQKLHIAFVQGGMGCNGSAVRCKLSEPKLVECSPIAQGLYPTAVIALVELQRSISLEMENSSEFE
jgi:hypothetical protein